MTKTHFEQIPLEAIKAIVEKQITEHFGVRGMFRQQFYLAPDFYQNYLYTGQRSWTIQPGFGFYLHY